MNIFDKYIKKEDVKKILAREQKYTPENYNGTIALFSNSQLIFDYKFYSELEKVIEETQNETLDFFINSTLIFQTNQETIIFWNKVRQKLFDDNKVFSGMRDNAKNMWSLKSLLLSES